MSRFKLLRVVGLSSAALYDKENPFNPINRRISIIVMNKEAEERVINDESAVRVTKKQDAESIAETVNESTSENSLTVKAMVPDQEVSPIVSPEEASGQH